MVRSNVWRPDQDERFAGNALAKKQRHAIRHVIHSAERHDRQRETYLRKEAGRIADRGAYGSHHWPDYRTGPVGYGGGAYGRLPRAYGYSRIGHHHHPHQHAYPRQFPVHHGGGYGFPRRLFPGPAYGIAPAPGPIYYQDSQAHRYRMDAAAADVFRAQEELEDVRAARQAESAVEMAQMARSESRRREYGRQLMIEGIELDRERREIQRDIQLDQMAERISRSASVPLIAPTPVRPGAPGLEWSRPGTPLLLNPYPSRPGTPFGSRPGTPYDSRPGTPYGSRPGTPYLRPISPAPPRLALPAPPLFRSFSGSQFGRASPGRSLRDFGDDETIMDELAEDLRQARMMGGGRRSSLGMRL